MDQTLVEGLAVAFYRRLGFDPSEPTSTVRLARTWLGAEAVTRGRNMIALAATYVMHGQRRIVVRTSVAEDRRAFLIGHELAHGILAEENYTEDDEEEVADSLGAALLAPPPSVRAAIRVWGEDTRSELAKHVRATETWAALRIGEVTHEPIAVVAPRVRVRGPESWVWPDEGTIRAWARRPPKGLAKARLRDDPRRVLLTADASNASCA